MNTQNKINETLQVFNTILNDLIPGNWETEWNDRDNEVYFTDNFDENSSIIFKGWRDENDDFQVSATPFAKGPQKLNVCASLYSTHDNDHINIMFMTLGRFANPNDRLHTSMIVALRDAHNRIMDIISNYNL